MANVSENFLSNLSQSIGISYDLKSNVLGSNSSPNSVLFNLLQIASILQNGVPVFGVYSSQTSFATINYNPGLNVFQFSQGQVFYKGNLITVPSQAVYVKNSTDTPGIKYFKFYLDYNDFNLASTVFTTMITGVNGDTITVNQLPSINYLNNFQQINLNGYLIGVQSINSNANTIQLVQNVSTFTFVGSTANLIFQPVIKTLITTARQGNPPEINIPDSGIILASAKINIDNSYNYSLIGSISILFVSYPQYTNPVNFFPTQAAYNAFLSTVNNAIKLYNNVQSYDIESALINSFINYTNGISTTKTTFDQYWHSQSYVPTQFFQYGVGYQGLQKVDFDKRFKDFWYFYKKIDLTRTFAIFRGDIYGGNAYVGQALSVFPGTVSVTNYIDYSDTSALNNGTYSYGVSAIVPSGEYAPVFAANSNFYFNNQINNYISWTSTGISNLLFFHVYKNTSQSNGFVQQRLTNPFTVTAYPFNDVVLPPTGSIGIGSSYFAIQIKSNDSSSGLIGGLYFNACFYDNSALTGIQSCVVVSSGQNYITPYVSISGNGSGASISISTNSYGGIESATVTNLGSGYTQLPTLTIFDSTVNSSGSGAVLLPILAQLNCGIFTGLSTSPIGTSIANLQSINIASLPTLTSGSISTIGVNMNALTNYILFNPNTYYWAVFSMNQPYPLTNNQFIQFGTNSEVSESFATSNNGSSWISGILNTPIARLGYLDKGSSGTVTSSRGVYLTNDKAATPERLQLYVPNMNLSGLSFNDIGPNLATGIGTTIALSIQNSMTVSVLAQNSQTGFQTTLIGLIPKGTPRNTSILLGLTTDLYDTVLDVFVQPNLSMGVNYVPNTNIINWTVWDFFSVDSSP